MRPASASVAVAYSGPRATDDLTVAGHSGPQTATDAPKIIISSRDGHPVPAVRPAERLAERARAAGWRVRLTYACAEVPDHHYANGNLARAAHRLETVAVRFPGRGRAVWESTNAGPWRFRHAWLGLDELGLRQITERIKG